MSEAPLIFRADMVRALLAGKKTQTRRVLTPRNTYFDGGPWPQQARELEPDYRSAWVDKGPSPAGNPGPYLHLPFPELGTTHRIYPRQLSGDRLWVRETFRPQIQEWVPYVEFKADDGGKQITVEQHKQLRNQRGGTWAWHPSIFLPRWASRISLVIERVRIERIQNISDGDVAAEGVEWGHIHEIDPTISPAQKAFRALWNEINEKRGFGWDANPFVLCFDFKVAENG